MDKLIMDRKSYDFICDWFGELKNRISELPLIFPKYEMEFCLDEVKKLNVHYIAECTKEKITFNLLGDKGFKFIANIEVAWDEALTVLKELVTGEYKKPPESPFMFSFQVTTPEKDKILSERDTKLAYSIIYYHAYVMCFLACFKPDFDDCTTLTVNKKVKKSKTGKKKVTHTSTVRVIQINQRVNNIKHDLESGELKLPRHYKRCDYTFGVRGHYRHYKSGKVVWIDAYKKNNGKTQIDKSRHYKFNLK